MRRDITTCPSCLQEHLRLKFKKEKTEPTATHYAECPVNLINIYIDEPKPDWDNMEATEKRDSVRSYNNGHGVASNPFII